ncbi:uncharacterized protein RSE6_05471 [Rhynchosporium secalis]|uniref:Uncharacterized protein n=1 Tax=Rhynchosporium secalis TaxID=38038 RepID=A0A1E1M7V6_RHYSE|nr:uncharacterized protein RSE6_05471 [Rhynchosporium secalis]
MVNDGNDLSAHQQATRPAQPTKIPEYQDPKLIDANRAFLHKITQQNEVYMPARTSQAVSHDCACIK